MSGKSTPKYTEEFKKTIVNLYQAGKTYSQISREYGISHSALANWIKKYSEVKMDDNTILTSKQIKELQKRNAQAKNTTSERLPLTAGALCRWCRTWRAWALRWYLSVRASRICRLRLKS